MASSIPASFDVNVIPSVLSAGGRALDLIAVALTRSTRVPAGAVYSFATPASVGSFFGLSSQEYAIASQYFLGFTGRTAVPAKILFAQYNAAAVPAYVRGASVVSLSVAALQALTGSLSVMIDGYAFSAANIVLTGATSFSAAAALIQTALNTAVPAGATALTVSFDSVSGAFTITSGTIGAASSAAFPTGTIATGLGLTSAVGAVTSQGAIPATPTTFFAEVLGVTQDFATFFTLWESSVPEAQVFDNWNTAQGDRFLFIHWSTDINNTTSFPTNTLAYLVGAEGSDGSGTHVVYAPVNGALAAAAVAGAIASIDYSAANGRTALKFLNFPGLPADVTNANMAANLRSNGVSFYGSFATANQQFTYYSNGNVTGPFAWVDSYVNQIWLNNQVQLSIMVGRTAAKSIPYAQVGYAKIQSWIMDPVEQGLTFGAIVPGVVLSNTQIDAINSAANMPIDGALVAQGYYILIAPASPQVRAARGSPPSTLWYLDGGSIQSISLASVEVQ